MRKIVNLDWSSKILQKFLSAWDIEKLGFPHKDFNLNTGTAYESVIVSQTWSSFLSSHQHITFCRHFSLELDYLSLNCPKNLKNFLEYGWEC